MESKAAELLKGDKLSFEEAFKDKQMSQCV